MTSRNPNDVDMTEELDAATNLLNSALDNYSKACSNLKLHYLPGSRIDTSPEFANQVLEELSLIASYATEIQQSKATVSRLHNFSASTNVRSIFSLPTEVLARIFKTVCNIHPCPQSATYVRLASNKPPPFAMEPMILSHVCSHWREIAINLADLWSHIDLVPNQLGVPRRLDRTNTYLARSGQTLLDIHIDQTSRNNDWDETGLPQTETSFLQLLTVIAPRVRSLTMRARQSSRGSFCRPVIFALFTNCVPGRLVYLDFGLARGTEIERFLTEDRGVDTDTTLVGLPKEMLESIWYPIKVLQLNQFYPIWTSKAYHGLVELDLNGNGSIPESSLTAILKSSPGLRILKIHFRVTHLTPTGARITPVPLVDLEQLTAIPGQELHLGYILRLIAPGKKPLGLTLVGPWLGSGRERPVKLTSRPETRSFFGRANVTRLYAHSFDTYKQLENILAMAPSVRVLVLDGCRCRQISEESALPPDFALDELYVIRSTEFGAVTWPSIEWMVQKHHVRKLTLWWYDHRYNGLGERETVVVPNNLHTVCPSVNLVSDENPNPIEDWK